jgi:hypothetical protein
MYSPGLMKKMEVFSKYEMFPEIWYSIFQNALKKWRDKYVG